jgi:hypothetical protein
MSCEVEALLGWRRGSMSCELKKMFFLAIVLFFLPVFLL